jgi:Carboxypeptidase regulatory-like domain
MTRFRSFVFRATCIFALLAGAVSSRAAVTFTNTPSTVSNTYNGTITLQITGLTNGETVVVQKFLDANTNGVIGPGDLLVQQFQLTDGQASAFSGVTNFNVPGDADGPANGSITTPLNFQNGDFAQSLVGQYLYKLSSPAGHFTPVTNLFTVTNAFFPALVTGAVENATSLTNVPNAIVLLFASQNGALNVKAGAVANNSGNFSIRAAPGIYYLAAAKSNFVADLSSAQMLTLTTNASTNSVTVNLTPATGNISGKDLDAATNSIGLPGVLGTLESTNNFFAIYFTDTNGNFSAPVTSNSWTAPADGFAAAFHGYLTWQTNRLVAVSNKVVSVTNALPKATAIFYGSVKDDSGNPMPGVYLYGSDRTNHQANAMTDQNGNYVAGALAGTNQLAVVAANNPGLTNFYVFSPGSIQTNVSAGEAILQNFILKQARYSITGSVKDFNGNAIVGVEVFATADINGTNYQTSTLTDAGGNYTLNVAIGDWTVGVLYLGSANSLQSLGDYQCPDDQDVNISDSSGNGTANFTVLLCGQIGILTTSLPDAWVGNYYATNLEATSCGAISGWSTAWGVTLTALYEQTNVTYPPGTPVYSKPSQIGYLLTPIAFGVTSGYVVYATNVTYSDVESDGQCATFYNLSATVNISGPITNNIVLKIKGLKWNAQPTTQSGSTYSTVLTLSSHQYCEGSGYNATNGTLVTNTVSSPVKQVGSLRDLFHGLTVGSSLNTDFISPYTNADNSVVWIGNAQYMISAYGLENATNIFDNLPLGLILYTNGTLAGTPTNSGAFTPTTNGLFNFTVRAVDTASNSAVQVLSLLVHPGATLDSAMASTNGQFQMQINGVAGANYTVQMTTNLTSGNWIPIQTISAPSNSFPFIDSNANDPSRFYRILIGQ